jgi:hypothetical protein
MRQPMKPEDLVMRLVTPAEMLFHPVPRVPCFEALEATLPRQLSPSFSFLFSHFTFPAFALGPIVVFGNSGTDRDWDLTVASKRDPGLAHPLAQQGYLQIGRPDTGSYDPVCFAFRSGRKQRDIPLVWLDHESLLIDQQVVQVKEIAASFDHFLQHAVESGWRPVRWEQ